MSANARLTRSTSSCERSNFVSSTRNVGSEPATAEATWLLSGRTALGTISVCELFDSEPSGWQSVGEAMVVRCDPGPNLPRSAIPAAIRS